MRARHKCPPPALSAAPSDPPPSSRLSSSAPLRSAIRSPPALGKFPPAADPSRRRPASALPSPAVPKRSVSQSPRPRSKPPVLSKRPGNPPDFFLPRLFVKRRRSQLLSHVHFWISFRKIRRFVLFLRLHRR